MSWSAINVRRLRASSYDESLKPLVNIFIYIIVKFGVFLIGNTGQKKLGKVICPDPWKTGARNTTGKVNFSSSVATYEKLCACV